MRTGNQKKGITENVSNTSKKKSKPKVPFLLILLGPLVLILLGVYTGADYLWHAGAFIYLVYLVMGVFYGQDRLR
jgi:hypothetical protein